MLNKQSPNEAQSCKARLIHALHCALCLLFFSVSIASANEEADRARLEALQQTISKLKQELDAVKKDRSKVQAELEASEKSIGELSGKARSLKEQLNNNQRQLNQLRDQRKRLHGDKQAQEKYVAKHINSAYRLGQHSQLRLFLNQQDPSKVSRTLHYYKHLVNARAEQISEFLTTIEELNGLEPKISQEVEAIRKNREALRFKRQKLRASQSKRQAVLDKLNAEIKHQNQEMQALNADRERLERLLTRVSEVLNETDMEDLDSAFTHAQGALPWPSKGSLLKSFGSRRAGNKLKWQGILIAAPAGAPVKTVHHGRVIFADYLRGHGLLIIIDHGDDYMTLYAHNQSLHKELGEWVATGERIATVGNTGGQKNNALYFELRHQGQPKNPKRWLKAS